MILKVYFMYWYGLLILFHFSLPCILKIFLFKKIINFRLFLRQFLSCWFFRWMRSIVVVHVQRIRSVCSLKTIVHTASKASVITFKCMISFDISHNKCYTRWKYSYKIILQYVLLTSIMYCANTRFFSNAFYVYIWRMNQKKPTQLFKIW